MTTAIDVACFGELLWDFYEADGKLFRRELGGVSANVAVALSRLGVESGAVGAVGKDKLGEALIKALAAEGVQTDHVVRLSAPTGITFVSQGADGESSFIPYRRQTADLMLAASDVTSTMGKAHYAVLSSTSMLASSRAATEKFLTAVEKAKGTVVVDLNVRAHLWPDADEMRSAVKELVARAALVKASERDLNAIAGKRGVTWLDDNAKHATWVLTRGDKGAAAIGPHGQSNAQTKRVRAVDTSGGGDAFMAGALAVLVKAGARPGSPEWKDGKLWSKALELGNILGAKAVTALGATTALVGLDDVKVRLKNTKKA